MIYCNKCQWKARLSNIIDKLCANNSNAVFIQTREKIFNDYLPYQEVYKISILKKYIKPLYNIIINETEVLRIECPYDLKEIHFY